MKKSVISKIFLSLWVIMLISEIISILFQFLAFYIPDIFFNSHRNHYSDERIYTDPNFIFWIVQILLIVLAITVFSLFISALIISINKLTSSGTKSLAITTSSMGLATQLLSLIFVFVFWGEASQLRYIIMGILGITILILSIISWVKTKRVSSNSQDIELKQNNDENNFDNKIRSLDKLLKESLITELEFKKAKKDILDKINE